MNWSDSQFLVVRLIAHSAFAVGHDDDCAVGVASGAASSGSTVGSGVGVGKGIV
jgi:hypothetical protein